MMKRILSCRLAKVSCLAVMAFCLGLEAYPSIPERVEAELANGAIHDRLTPEEVGFLFKYAHVGEEWSAIVVLYQKQLQVAPFLDRFKLALKHKTLRVEYAGSPKLMHIRLTRRGRFDKSFWLVPVWLKVEKNKTPGILVLTARNNNWETAPEFCWLPKYWRERAQILREFIEKSADWRDFLKPVIYPPFPKDVKAALTRGAIFDRLTPRLAGYILKYCGPRGVSLSIWIRQSNRLVFSALVKRIRIAAQNGQTNVELARNPHLMHVTLIHPQSPDDKLWLVPVFLVYNKTKAPGFCVLASTGDGWLFRTDWFMRLPPGHVMSRIQKEYIEKNRAWCQFLGLNVK